MAEEESLLTQEEMEAIGLEPDQVSRSRWSGGLGGHEGQERSVDLVILSVKY